MTQWWLLEALANAVISLAYLCIATLITVPLIQLRQLRSNKLATATAAIFLSCSVGHGLHAYHGSMTGHTPMGTWSLALWHSLTACVAVYYLTLRRFYGRLLSAAPLYHDLSERQRLLDLEAFQAEVTARTAAESDRDHYAAMLESINQNSQSAIYVKDLEGRYLMANAATLDSLGIDKADLIGKTDEAFNAELAPLWRAADRKAQEGPYRLEEFSEGPEGRRYFDSSKFPLFDGDGKMYAICGISLNITESKRANAALAEARDVALAATEAKSAFLATMSHEIRTPMNAVIGMTDLLLDTRLDEQQHEFLETVRSSGDALLAVINDILDFSKIESRELRLEREPFNLRDEVEGTMDLVAAAAAGKGLDLVCYVDESCPMRVVGDAAHLRQILINLLSNAVKFTATGEVLMTMSAVSHEEHLQATISVTDSGIGISADGVSKLFRSFSQVDASPTRAYGGTGLGLAISKRLAEAMGGDITVSSIPGEGSTFTVTVVLGQCEQTGDDTRLLGAEPSLAGVSVLIVDDNQSNLRILDLQLSSLQMNCTTAATPAEALRLVADGYAFDVAVLDMNMPEMDGVQLAEGLRQHPTVQGTPMILLTSMGSRPPGSSSGFTHVLAKPVKSAVLRAALSTSLHGTLDVSDAAQTRRQAMRHTSAPLRILLAEDNPVNQRVAELMLAKLGHAVDIVDNGLAAVQAAVEATYDVVLMDVQMPQLDGMEATRRIRSLVPAEQQPHIIAMTANAMLEDQEACSAAGMESYLTKPVRVQELRSMLARVSATIRTESISEETPEEHAEETASDEADQHRDPPIDQSVLAQLGDDLLDDDGSLIGELIDKFLDDGSSTMSALDRAAAADQALEVRRLAHAFASSSELLGALPLTVLLRRAESLATENLATENLATENLASENLATERLEEMRSVSRAVQSEYARVADALGAALIARNGPASPPEQPRP